VKRLQQLCPGGGTLDDENRRGFPRQRRQRQLEQALRRNVVDLAITIHDQGRTFDQTADFLHLSSRTLRFWLAGARVESPILLPLGRPTMRSPREQRNVVLAVLDECGPATGLPTLQECFPDMPRAELDDLLRRYRLVWRQRHMHAPHILEWITPGTVWAIDYSRAPAPIDGLYPDLLAVRDLASGQQLLWLPVIEANAEQSVAALSSLFALYGPPLVLKTDNGSPFGAYLTQRYLQQSGVIPLFSPPYTPQYNGAVEAGIGSLKMRSERHAARCGHPGYWTMDDVAYAQLDANATSRPQGPQGPTAEQLWTRREVLTAEQRLHFHESVQRNRLEILSREGEAKEEGMLTSMERLMDREAIRRALGEHGFLLFSRRRIPLPITRQKTANIT